ncbi:hypothetical protein A9975_09945 [Cupriavidus sp. UME77]|nr:hypothetical protein [Cupriavidus sp. UME77]
MLAQIAVVLFATAESALGACVPDQPSVSGAGRQRVPSRFPGAEWTRAAPRGRRVLAGGGRAGQCLRKAGRSTAGMIVHGGRVVAEWGDVLRDSNLHSARKRFMSALFSRHVMPVRRTVVLHAGEIRDLRLQCREEAFAGCPLVEIAPAVLKSQLW